MGAVPSSEIERDIGYLDNAHARGIQVRARWEAFAKQVECKRNSLYERIRRNQELKAANDREIAIILGQAYQSLENLVQHLILLPNGNERVGTKDEKLVSAMAQAADFFSSLSSRADCFSQEFGRLSSDSMQYGDDTDNFLTSITSWGGNLELEINAISATLKGERNALDTLGNSEPGLQRAVFSAREKRDDLGNQILSFFDGDRERELNNLVAIAENTLHSNQNSQAQLRQKIDAFETLRGIESDILEKIKEIKLEVEKISAEYDSEFSRLSDVRDTNTDMWAGILKLKDHVCSPGVRSTRDNSLRAVLHLLVTDDVVLNKDPVAEDAQQRIYTMIDSKLGAGAVWKLVEPTIVSLEEFALEWPDGLP